VRGMLRDADDVRKMANRDVADSVKCERRRLRERLLARTETMSSL
jgi:hypothetical protein